MVAKTASEVLAREREDVQARVNAINAQLAALHAATRDSNIDDEHDPEGSTVAFERAQLMALLGQASEHALEVESAFERVAAGSYGTCETCRGAIAPARLEALPSARACIACASTGRAVP